MGAPPTGESVKAAYRDLNECIALFSPTEDPAVLPVIWARPGIEAGLPLARRRECAGIRLTNVNYLVVNYSARDEVGNEHERHQMGDGAFC